MAYGLIPRKEMTRYEKISILLAFFIFLGSILPWYILIIESTFYFLGIMTTVGIFVMVIGFEMIFLMWLRRPVVEGIDNSTITMFMSLIILCISVYVLRYAFFSKFAGGQLVEGFAGTGLYIDILASFLLLMLAYKVRSDRKKTGQGAFATEVAVTGAKPVQPPGPTSSPEKDGGFSLTSLFMTGSKAKTEEKTVTKVAPVGGVSEKTEDKPTTSSPIQPASPPTTASSRAEKTSGPSRESLLHWLNHVTRDKQVYERCPGCNSYSFMNVRKRRDTVFFSCQSCGSEYKLVL